MIAYSKIIYISLLAFTLVPTAKAQDNGSDDSTDVAIRQKAEAGDREAQNLMGFREQENKNYTEALRWFMLSAKQGLSDAQVNVGFFYELGLGVEKNPKEEAYWYGLAAAEGDPYGEHNLGICYSDGDGVPQNWELALNLFIKAMNHGFDEGTSANSIGLVYEARPHADKNSDYAQAFRWFLRGADLGDDSAEYNVCRLAAQGLGITKDYQEARKWCSHLADKPDADGAVGQYGMGRIYQDGLGVPQDSHIAVNWFRKSAERGFSPSQLQLSELYSLGKGVERDLVQAYRWAKIAESLKHPSASQFLSELSKQLSKDQVLCAEELASKWLKEHPPDPERVDHTFFNGKPHEMYMPHD